LKDSQISIGRGNRKSHQSLSRIGIVLPGRALSRMGSPLRNCLI
jgi:hypothetical protein